MMKSLIKIGFLAFAFFGCNAFAEGGCPAGSYPIGGGSAGWQGCAPIPGYDSGQGQDNGPRGHWEDSYGALAFGKRSDGTWSYAYGTKYKNKKRAEEMALLSCQEADLTECTIAQNFENSFLAISRDEAGDLYTGFHDTEGGAKEAAINSCKQYNMNECKVVKIVDSRAVWVN